MKLGEQQISITQLNALLVKTSDWDKDERYMATNDLCNALQRDLKMDENMEQRICAAVLKQLDDQSNDVQSVAVKCLAIIIKKVQKAQIGSICTKLCSLILEGQDTLRDVYSIGLKTLIVDVPGAMGSLVADILTVKLLSGINSSVDDIQRECLDIMADLLRRFGHLNSEHHNNIMTVVVDKLGTDRMVLRKRATHCLGSLAVVSSDGLLNLLMQTLLQRIEEAEVAGTAGESNTHVTRTLIQTIGAISRTVGFRLGRHLERIVPLFIRFCGDPDIEDQQTDTFNELRENCFPGLESFVLRCPIEVTPYLSEILNVSLKFMKYDPNYNYDDGDEDGDEDGCGDMDVDGDEDDEDYEDDDDDYGASDDDDTSWKVRKAAVKVIGAAIQTRPDMVQELYTICGDVLIRRFKEREENVRLDIIKAFTAFMHSGATSGNVSTGATQPQRAKFVLPMLEEKLPRLVSTCCKQLTGISVKTKSAVLSLLQTLTAALEGRGLDDYVPRLMQQIEKCLLEKSHTLKLDALVYLRVALQNHKPVALQPSMERLLELVISAGKDEWYKIIAETLRVEAAAIPILRPRDMQSGKFIDDFRFEPLLRRLHDAVLPRLEALDMDQEIKECAIHAAGQIISYGGDILITEVPNILSIFTRRIENETTRVATLRALISIASSASSTAVDLSAFLSSNAKDLSLFMRQSSRILKQLSLQVLYSIITAPSTKLTAEVASTVLSEAAVLIDETDLHLSQLSLNLALALLQKDSSATAAAFREYIYPRIILAAKSSLIQGQALTMLINIFRALADSDLPGMSHSETFSSLYNMHQGGNGDSTAIQQINLSCRSTVGNDYSKAALGNLSKCIGALFKSDASLEAPVTKFMNDLNDTAGCTESMKQLALLCLGEVGQTHDLSRILTLKEQILSCFESSAEDTKLAAAYALGHIAVGNMACFLPVVLQSAESDRQQYLLLVALKEIITTHAFLAFDFRAHLPHVLPTLVQHCQAEEESVRNMVAECLGVLTAMISDQTIPVLLQLLNEDKSNALSRRMVANAIRFSLARNASAASVAAVKEVIGQFLPLLDDSDLEVKRAALLMVNTAVHHFPDTVAQHLSEKIIPVLLETLKIKMERSVDLGPFKHKVDDNLPLRKISLTCIETIFDNSVDHLDVSSFMQVMPLLIADKDDIKMQAHQILSKICTFAPGVVLGQVDQLVTPLAKSLKKKATKDDASGGPQADRSLDLVRSSLRVVLAINSIEDVGTVSRGWVEFFDGLRKDEFTNSLLQSIDKERVNDAL